MNIPNMSSVVDARAISIHDEADDDVVDGDLVDLSLLLLSTITISTIIIILSDELRKGKK